MSYKSCAVPACKNTTIKTPEKLFITVPKNVKVRKKWFQLARRDPLEIKESSVIFFCQDHFNIEKDMANYYQYNMGLSQRIIMVDGAMPTKFDCQEDSRKKMIDASASGPVFVKRQRTQLIQECQDSQTQEVLSKTAPSSTPTTMAVQEVVLMTAKSQQTQDKSTYTNRIVTREKGTQFNFKHKVHFRSKATQTMKTSTKELFLLPNILSHPAVLDH